MTIMTRLQGPALVALLAILGGCGVTFHPKQPGDTACLGEQVRDFHVEFYRAVQICHTPDPDLTGDFELQQYARTYDIPYQYNPRLDGLIKNHNWRDMLLVGSNIPNDYGLNAAEVDVGGR